MADTININGVLLTPEALSEIKYLQESDISKLTINNIDVILDYVLDTSPAANAAQRLDMETTLHSFTKLIKILTTQ